MSDNMVTDDKITLCQVLFALKWWDGTF